MIVRVDSMVSERAAGRVLLLWIAFHTGAAAADEACIGTKAVKVASACSFEGEESPGTKKVEGLPEELKPKTISQEDAKKLDEYSAMLCEEEDKVESCRIKVMKARIFYDANRFEEAAFLFGEAAVSCPDDEAGKYAIVLFFDSLNVLTKLPGKKKACMAQLAEAAGEFLTGKRFEPYLEDKVTGGMLCDVKCAAERHLAQELHNKGKFVEAAESYLVLYDEFHAPCPGAKMDEILYNLAVELGSAGLNGGALKVYAILAREKSYATSLLAEKALFYMCQVSYGLAEFEEAAGYCEEYAAKYPASKEAPEALEEAAFLRGALGQQEEAVEDAWLFQKSYAKAKPDEAAKVLAAAGMGYVRAEQWPQAILHFGKLLKAFKEPETAGLQLRADVEIGAAYWSLKSYAKAEKFFNAAVEIYEQLSKQEGGGAAAGDGAVQEAAARAYFFLGEIYFQKFEKTGLPKFNPGSAGAKGKPSSPGQTEKELKKVNQWLKKKLSPVISKKSAFLKKADANYAIAVSIPSPEWSIAATARRAQMMVLLYESLQAVVKDVDEYRIGLMPELEVYFNTYAGEPFVHLPEKAADGFRVCLDKSRELKVSNEWTGLCEAQLNKIDPQKYPVIHEILPAGSPQQQEISFPGPAEKKEAGVKLSEKLLEFVQ